MVFVLATTNPEKVLPTIRSRTQHLEVHLFPADELEGLVDFVVADAWSSAQGRTYVLRTGGGSARDTLSALDRVVAAGGAPTPPTPSTSCSRRCATTTPAAPSWPSRSPTSRGRNPRRASASR